MKKIVISEQRRAEIIARLQDTGITRTEVAMNRGSLFRDELNEIAHYGKFRNENFD